MPGDCLPSGDSQARVTERGGTPPQSFGEDSKRGRERGREVGR